MSRQALILAGGLGSRLGLLTRNTPKPLLEVAGHPFLHYIFWNLQRQGVTRIILSVGYLAQQFREIFGDGSLWGLELSYSIETEPLGTGGALRHAAAALDETFLVINGDTLFDIDFTDLSKDLSGDILARMALRRVADVARYGRVSLDKGLVDRFCEKGRAGPGVINGGIYLLHKEVLEFLPEGSCSLEEDLFPALVRSKRLVGESYEGFFLDIGLPETYHLAQTLLPAWQEGCPGDR